MDCEIRPAHEQDANAISRLIIAALQTSNAQDYPAAVIAQVRQNFSPPAVRQLLSKRQVWVAQAAGEIIGTASLDGQVVRSVFVAPERQGQGVGRQLMAELEHQALGAGITQLTVPSSITAEGFYTNLGFHTLREQYHGEERTLIMQRELDQTTHNL
ncbi:GNAT family N-acetyltransferase [Pseudomonas chlororaphis]|uniref:GNAT family N-acetyltransferase n=1 Tax=Pseudomonas chlororaphis TaxID=587753 RepID=UPI001B3082FE|nr:GNAT family N-acetyltransferase [Pseudomonas chlororaphis]MBP5060177.1 GNAT family N-acetyltransferase [Pseudomonas chlororaphis]MBP5143580.1 GNAT family N-acetyltransferase [Pseudomonas chlororaphis]QTU03300.1 GNAT family N-acetyltransferase [Pseudomonas chlororaphis]